MNMPTYLEQVKRVTDLFDEADYILIGAGSGLSAAAGLNYTDPELFKNWFPVLARRGIQTIWDAVKTYWHPDDENRRAFWAYWANHIQKIRYDAPPGAVYLNLHKLVKEKKHFVITTNVDGQFAKAGFDSELVFGPQGDYACFQCEVPCKQVVHDNRVYIQQMLSHIDDEKFLISEADIPRCPNCGKYLERNLRIDQHFVEAPHLTKQNAYMDFINNSVAGKLILMELGVGFNTPVIIRWPFEKIILQHPHATLVRINLHDAQVAKEIEQKTICIAHDLALTIQAILTNQHSDRDLYASCTPTEGPEWINRD